MINSLHIVVARKPIEGNNAENTILHGCGGININDCRIQLQSGESTYVKPAESKGWCIASPLSGSQNDDWKKGRWPANVIHDGSDQIAVAMPDVGGGSASVRNNEESKSGTIARFHNQHKSGMHFGDKGSAARFFKAVKYSEKD